MKFPDMTPSDSQARAIRAIVDWYREPSGPQVFYLAGYAGTGKSTVANFAVNELRAKCGISKIPTGAFTGKAASVLRKKGVEGAQTIHSMIYRVQEDETTNKPVFVLDPMTAAADADLILLDEISMVDEDMARDVRSYGKKILVMGDPGQLPPVRGQGAFTSREPDYFLTEIHRQAAESPIIRIATLARQGRTVPIGDYGQGVLVKKLDRDNQTDVYQARTQAICGVHRVRWTITQRYRARLGFDGRRPVAGERIMCRKNQKTEGIFNGQGGSALRDARELEPGGTILLDARLDDMQFDLTGMKVHPYLFDQHFDGPSERPRIPRGHHEFDWGYVLTCHSAQGSEWPHVTIVDDSGSFRDDRDRWLYTAITRASEGLTLLKRAA